MDIIERRRLTKEVGLEALYRVSRFASGSEFLHFGLFEADIPRDFRHLREAQERYLERLIEIIPPGTKSILDVGAGSGRTAEVLIGRGFNVDCVSPGTTLADIAENRLRGRSVFYRGQFEEVEIERHYDLVLFSESFQYIEIETAMTKALSLLQPGGHIMICDFFRTRPSRMGGGHSYDEWRAYLDAGPVESVYERDITEETSTTLDIVATFSREVAQPLSESLLLAVRARWPIPTSIVRLIFRRRIQAFARRYLSHPATGADFRRDKVYKTYLLRRRAA